MGSYETVGKELDKVHEAKEDYILYGLSLFLIFIGIFSLWFMEKTQVIRTNIHQNLAIKNIVFVGMGALCAFLVMKFDYRSIKKHSKKIYVIGIVVSIFSIVVGKEINGSIGYLIVGQSSINVLFISTFILVISLAGIFDEYDWNSKKSTLKGLSLGFGPMIVLIFAKSLSIYVIYVLSVIVLLVISGIRIKYLVYSIGGLVTATSGFMLSSTCRKYRAICFFNPEIDLNGAGYQYKILREIRSKTGLLMQQNIDGIKKVPEIQGEFILSYIMFTFGFIACAVLVTFVAIFIVRMVLISKNTKDSYGKIIGGGICTFLSVQFIWNILMNLALMPVMGIGMPFVSYGGSNMIISIVSISIISSIYKWRNTPYKLSSSI